MVWKGREKSGRKEKVVVERWFYLSYARLSREGGGDFSWHFHCVP